MEAYAKLRQQDNQDIGIVEKPVSGKGPLPEEGAPPDCVPAGHHQWPPCPPGLQDAGYCMFRSSAMARCPLGGTQAPTME